MPLSFTLRRPLPVPPDAGRRRVLVTGAAGHIGSYFAEHAHDSYDLRLMVQDAEEGERVRAYGEVVQGDLGDLERLKELCAGIDTVLHLAADPDPSAGWESILPNNIIGTYHIMVAAKHAGCRRLVYASSIHAVSGHPPDVQVKTSEPVNPGDLYGVSKCFGEALGRYMAEQEGLSVIAIRIGGFQPVETVEGEEGIALLDAFVSRRDLRQLIELCIDDEQLSFAIVQGLSDNYFKRLDISDARELLGYAPRDDAFAENPDAAALHLQQRRSSHNVSDPGQESGVRPEVE